MIIIEKIWLWWNLELEKSTNFMNENASRCYVSPYMFLR
jgi:hypothetical protein